MKNFIQYGILKYKLIIQLKNGVQDTDCAIVLTHAVVVPSICTISTFDRMMKDITHNINND